MSDSVKATRNLASTLMHLGVLLPNVTLSFKVDTGSPDEVGLVATGIGAARAGDAAAVVAALGLGEPGIPDHTYEDGKVLRRWHGTWSGISITLHAILPAAGPESAPDEAPESVR